MVKCETQTSESLIWLKYVLNPETEIPKVTNWTAIFEFADKHKIASICIPTQGTIIIEKDLLFEWIGIVQLIETQNKLQNKRIVELFNKIESDGFAVCLLKGQGNAQLYPNPLTRSSGDIDVWIDANEEKIYEYVKNLFPDTKESFKHIHFPIFNDVPVDAHFTPLKFYSQHYQKKLQRWIKDNKQAQFEHYINLAGVEKLICAPTEKFNAVYLLGHMLIHVNEEGIGLRQVVDYYYLLNKSNFSIQDREDIIRTFNDFGMNRFAKAVMWIEWKVLGLSKGKCLVEPDKKLGRLLLKDIVEGGNFGFYSNIFKRYQGYYSLGIAKAWRNIKLLPLMPREGCARLRSKLRRVIKHVLNRFLGRWNRGTVPVSQKN